MTRFMQAAARLLGVFPHLCIAGAFMGSAVIMKVAPLLGLAPQQLQQEVFEAYEKFISLPLLHPLVSLFGLSAGNVMLALALTHIVAVALLLLPSGVLPSRAAGAWIMISMAGAEYCTRMADVAPPMTPKQFKRPAQVLATLSHIFLFLCGAYCTTRTSFGLATALGRKPYAGRCEDTKKPAASKDGKCTMKVDPKDVKPKEVNESKEASRKRTTTPPPKAKKNLGYRHGSVPQRGAAAMD